MPQHTYIMIQLYSKYLYQIQFPDLQTYIHPSNLHTAYMLTHLDIYTEKKEMSTWLTPFTLKYSPSRAYSRRSNQRASDSQTAIPTEAALEERRHSRARQKFPETSTIKRDLQGFRSTSNEFASTRDRKPSDLCLHALKKGEITKRQGKK